MSDKEKEYSERARDWKNISVNQISFTNNLISTLSAGYLLYLFDKFPNSGVIMVKLSEADWKLTFYVLTLILVILALFSGVLTLLCRLYDFRVTRNIVLTRKRIYKKHNRLLPDSTVNGKGFVTLIGILFTGTSSIQKTDCDEFSDELTKTFNNLRTEAITLGKWTWRLTKVQLLVIFIAVVTHFITILK